MYTGCRRKTLGLAVTEIADLGDSKRVFGERENTSDTYRLRLGTSPFLTLQHALNVVDHLSSIHNVLTNIGGGSMRVSQLRRW